MSDRAHPPRHGDQGEPQDQQAGETEEKNGAKAPEKITQRGQGNNVGGDRAFGQQQAFR